ncbi:MAG: protein TolR [Myxococcota bacterium]|jgi:biopolymer transport protein TolR
MGTNKQKGGNTTLSEINVTPMVDVMLVLLVIFMVTAPLVQQGVKVDLPKVKAMQMTSDESRVIITIDKDRKIYIGKAEIPLEQLETKISANERLKGDREVFLYADRALPYGFVVKIMSVLKKAGVDQVGMVTEPGED